MDIKIRHELTFEEQMAAWLNGTSDEHALALWLDSRMPDPGGDERYNSGHAEGYEEGYDEGYDEGYEEGYDAGYAECERESSGEEVDDGH